MIIITKEHLKKKKKCDIPKSTQPFINVNYLKHVTSLIKLQVCLFNYVVKPEIRSYTVHAVDKSLLFCKNVKK